MEFVGRRLKKEFEGFGVFFGKVKSYDSTTGFFEIVYEDGDSEELELSEVTALLDGMVEDQSTTDDLERRPATVGRKPKKRGRFGDLGNSSPNNSTNLVNSKCLNGDFGEIQGGNAVSQEGCGKTLEEECGVGDHNLDVGSTHSLNLNEACEVLNQMDNNNGTVKEELKNLNEMNVKPEVVSSKGLDLNAEVNLDTEKDSRKSGAIDLNLDANEDEDGNFNQGDLEAYLVSNQKKEQYFDLNLGLNDDVKILEAECLGNLKEKTCVEMEEEAQKMVIDGYVEAFQLGGGSEKETSEGVQIGNFERTSVFCGLEKEDCVFPGSLKRDASLCDLDVSNNTSPLKIPSHTDTTTIHGHQDYLGSASRGNNRKRRKILESANSRMETVLRRSARRVQSTFSAEDHTSSEVASNLNSDTCYSPTVSAFSEEKSASPGCEQPEEHSVLPPKLKLPPSSDNLNLEDIPILDLFSVYTFLRSFSTLLFLSPFRLEDFVAAVNCQAPNLLFDFIHVSLLQTLRKHLRSIADESSQSASSCLSWGLNGDFLDLITWPIYMVEYLVLHGSRMKFGFDVCCLKLFESDYYEQPASVKLEILRCLCDDAIEVEGVRSELNRRTLIIEHCMDFDRDLKFETSRKKRPPMDVTGGYHLAEEVDETADWNSDECCLCKMDGSLICCDGCPAAFHSRCVGVATSLLPEGDWYCPECMIDKDKPWMKVGRSIRGAELLGIDPYGRLYYSSCGYLLVSDSCDTGSSSNYYHISDLITVIETLNSSSDLYGTIIAAISNHWDLYIKLGAKSELVSQNLTEGSCIRVKRQTSVTSMSLMESSETCIMDEIVYEGKPEAISSISTCSEIPNGISAIQNTQSAGLDCPNNFDVMLNNYELPGKVEECQQGKTNRSADHSGMASTLAKQRDDSQGTSGTSYFNCYSFARTALLAAEELNKQSDKISQGKSVEEMISLQLKAISKKANEFCWPNIHYLCGDVWKEKCGWCFSCKDPDEERDCLFVMNDIGPISDSFTSEVLGFHSRTNRRGHLNDLICGILFIEDRLHGLLLGPWLNPDYSKIWRRCFLKASDVASVKHLLLGLESNLHRLAVSTEWVKCVDSAATMGSAVHFSISSVRESSRQGIGRKRGRCSEPDHNPSSNNASGLVLFWWRGGRLSRQLFSWKAVPRSLVSKAARQGGCKKIPGILYPDGSEFAKRSKNIAWRAAVEASRSVEQLAHLVRELDSNIKWDEIENTKLLSLMDKESKRSVMSFRKSIIRRKCSEGLYVKYLIDFGKKRRFIPDVVAKHGSMLEESSSGRRKYWLEDTHVPLYLLKVFEEKRIARKSNKMNYGELKDSGRIWKRLSKENGFSYLFSRAERLEKYKCGHCNKDVLIRDAVSCHFCKGFFHRRHVKKSDGAMTFEWTYTCHKCRDMKFTKIDTKNGKLQLQNSKKAAKVRSTCSKVSKNTTKDKKSVQPATKRKISACVPLRRSSRNVKHVSLQSKKVGSKKVGRPKKKKRSKIRKITCKNPKSSTWQKKRTEVFRDYWLNGIHFSRKPNDERVMHFRSKKLLFPSEQMADVHNQPRCSLCLEESCTSSLVYISCEICADWFHGDAFGLRTENAFNLIGFKCHNCRSRSPPLCPHLHARSVEVQTDTSECKTLLCTHEISVLVMDSNSMLPSNRENGHLCISLEDKTEASHNLDENWRMDALMESNENVLSEDKTIELAKGHINVSASVETGSQLSQSNVK